MTEHPKDATRVAAGLKAAIHNPNVSEEAKARSIERLREMGEDIETGRESHPSRHERQEHVPEESTRVLAGYKATISNPHTSPEAKKHAEEVLQAAGVLEKRPDDTDEEHQTRVLAGYKAALRNPRVSDEAKKHAHEYLKEHGVEDAWASIG